MAHAQVAHAAAPCVTPLALVDDEPDPHWVERGQTAPRCQGSGRPQRVVVLDESIGNFAVHMIEFVEVVRQCVPLELVLYCSGDESAQALITQVLLVPSGRTRLPAGATRIMASSDALDDAFKER